MKNKRIHVAVRQGTLSGIVEENAYDGHYIAFRGIPYAKPPLGKLRFKDPVPAESWLGVRDASKFGNVAPQADMITRKIIGNEDCLYLNVYTTNIEPTVKRAVMVWIHGGGFYTGSGNDDLYGADHIVEKDVVLVTLNYRLGVLGFLNLDHELATGNQGLKDVVLALRWVHENISNFGGDPRNVTIFGESAGGAIVHLLTMSPLANGLYHKAISQSGVGIAPWTFTQWQKGYRLAEKLGKKTSDPKTAIEFLRTIESEKLIEATPNTLTLTEHQQFIIAFTPSYDYKSRNPFFKENPALTMRRGVKVPFLLGFTNNEGTLFTRNLNEKIYRLLDSNFESAIHPKLLPVLKQKSITIDDLRFLYFGNKPVSEETLMNYAELMGDLFFYRPAYEAADIQMQKGHPTYMYKFSYESEISVIKAAMSIDLPGVTHAEELFYLFHPRMMREIGLELYGRDSNEYKVTKYMTQMWTNFAKTGNPTPTITDTTPILWKPLKKGNVYNYLNIDKNLRMETARKGEQRFDWKKIKHKI